MRWGEFAQICMALLVLSAAGCASTGQPRSGITVTSLDLGDVPSVPVGQFDVYTESFLVANPTNLTYDNVEVDISLHPTLSYCHAIEKTFSYPQFFPLEKKTEQISIAEFADLGCTYNYTYTVSSEGG